LLAALHAHADVAPETRIKLVLDGQIQGPQAPFIGREHHLTLI